MILACNLFTVFEYLDKELKHIMLDTIDSNHSLIFQRKLGLSALMLQIVNPEVLNVVEILLFLCIVTSEIAPSIQAFGDKSGVFALYVLLECFLMLLRLLLNSHHRESIVDTCLSGFLCEKLHWIEALVLVQPYSYERAMRYTRHD